MESLGGILGILAVLFLPAIIGLIFRAMGAAGRAAVGKGSLGANFQAAFVGMQPLEVRLKDSRMGDAPDAPLVKAIEVKGKFPLQLPIRAAFWVSIFDRTNGGYETILCPIEAFQEEGTIAFQTRVEVGRIGPNQGFMDWVRVGAAIPDIMIAPRSGQRRLSAAVRLIDLDNAPVVTLGQYRRGDRILWERSVEFQQSLGLKGYLEEAESREKARAMSIHVAMAVAMADGVLHKQEGAVLQAWVSRTISPYSGEERERLKRVYNDAIRTSFGLAQQGRLNVRTVAVELARLNELAVKYETIELCYDIMGADGETSPTEASAINSIVSLLNLDAAEVARIRDSKLVGGKIAVSSGTPVEELFGIKETDDGPTVRRKLMQEFQKWNSRITTLPAGPERDQAQQMLDKIADVRKKYG